VPSRKRPNCSRRTSGEDAIQVTVVPFLGNAPVVLRL
jgi:hypothetical protein